MRLYLGFWALSRLVGTGLFTRGGQHEQWRCICRAPACQPRRGQGPDDDIPKAQNVFRITGSPSSITPANVAELKGRYQERFSQLSAPKIALLCGGSTKNRQ